MKYFTPAVDKITDSRVKSNYTICGEIQDKMKTDEERKQQKINRKKIRKMIDELD